MRKEESEKATMSESVYTKLTENRKRFVDFYLAYRNGTKAYQEAYEKPDPETKELVRANDNVAAVEAHKLLKDANIIAAIGERQAELEKLSPICSIEELAESWSNDIRFDIKDLVDDDGNPKNPKDLPPKTRRLIQGFKIKERVIKSEGGEQVIKRTYEYKLPDRQNARKELGKRIGFYPEGTLGDDVININVAIVKE